MTSFYETCITEGYTEADGMMECFAKHDFTTYNNIVYGVNVLFIIYAASLVFFMQAGFAMLCAGCVRKKNVQNTMLKNLLDACGSALSFFSFGYAFAYGDDGKDMGKTFIGSSRFFLMGSEDDGLFSNWLFQFAFAATAGEILKNTLV